MHDPMLLHKSWLQRACQGTLTTETGSKDKIWFAFLLKWMLAKIGPAYTIFYSQSDYRQNMLTNAFSLLTTISLQTLPHIWVDSASG